MMNSLGFPVKPATPRRSRFRPRSATGSRCWSSTPPPAPPPTPRRRSAARSLQIAKSLVFRGAGSNHPVLVVASGVNRVDETKVAAALGEGIARADADFVREATGFAIGGVPPVGHKNPPTVLIDESLDGVRRDLGRGRHAQRRLSLDAVRPHRTDWRTRRGDRSPIGGMCGLGCKTKSFRQDQDRRRRLDLRTVAGRVLPQRPGPEARARICERQSDLDRDQRHLLRVAEAGELRQVA